MTFFLIQRAVYRCEVEMSPRPLERMHYFCMRRHHPSVHLVIDMPGFTDLCQVGRCSPLTLRDGGQSLRQDPVISGADQRRQVCSQQTR